jgi:hypothetical protein
LSCNTQTLLKSNLQSTFLDPIVKTRELKSKNDKILDKIIKISQLISNERNLQFLLSKSKKTLVGCAKRVQKRNKNRENELLRAIKAKNLRKRLK